MLNELQTELFTNLISKILESVVHPYKYVVDIRPTTFTCSEPTNLQQFDCIFCEIAPAHIKNPSYYSNVIRILVHDYIHVITWNEDKTKYNFWVLSDPNSIEKAIKKINVHLKRLSKPN